MKRLLLRSSAFIRATRRTVKKYPRVADDIQATLDLLIEDVFHPKLQAHKLKGKLEGSWTCRIQFEDCF